MQHPRLALAGLFVTSVLLSGCTAPAQSADATQETPKAVKQESAQDDARTYSTTGSWIPRKVKKKEDVIGTNTQTASKEAMAKAQMQGTSHMAQEPPPRQ